MDSQSMNRKDFFRLTFTLVGGAAVVAGCSSSSKGGTGGSSGSGSGGAAAHVDASSGGSSGDAKIDTASADTGMMCADPLVTVQLPDTTGHTHTLYVPASTLSMTTDQSWLTSGYPPGSGGHFHTVVLKVADLATLKGGGSVTVTSSMDGDPLHSHMFMVSCTGD